jgi:hypothetical protein
VETIISPAAVLSGLAVFGPASNLVSGTSGSRQFWYLPLSPQLTNYLSERCILAHYEDPGRSVHCVCHFRPESDPGRKHRGCTEGTGERGDETASRWDDCGHAGQRVGQDYLFLATSASPVTVSVDLQPQKQLAQVDGNHWMMLTKMRTGVLHQYQFYAAGKPLGTRGDAVGYNPDSYPKPGVPHGKLSAKHTLTSKIYDGMKYDFWVYTSAGVDPNVPAPLMVWQDRQNLTGELSGIRLITVTENLVQQGLLAPIVHVMIASGTSPEGRPMRSIEYDTVSDRYPRFLMEEVLPEVGKTYNLRQDAYSRAIAGESSGGICAFNAAWFMPDKFARVHSAVGSFTSIQWRSKENVDGGNVYRFMVRKEPKRNIRLWMSDGADDLENNHGS